MNINIKATNIELTDDIKGRVNKSLEAISKVVDSSDDQFVGQVEVGKISNHHQSGDIFKAEMNLRAKGETYFASSEQGDLSSALEAVKDIIVADIKKTKSRKQSLIRKGGNKAKTFIKGFFK
jgi:ribosomal subunit interface protein